MKSLKRFFRPSFALALLTATSLSSCNRGYGCPTNFSLSEVVDTVVGFVALF